MFEEILVAPVTLKTQARRKDGSKLAIEMTLSTVTSVGERVIMAVARDDSARRRLEELNLEAKHKAEEANRAKSEFLARMSHELRTPLNAIILYAQMLADDAADTNDRESATDLGKILTAGHHLLELINDVLDLSKIEAGELELNIQELDLHAVLRECATIAESLAAKRGNRLAVRQGNFPGKAISDERLIRQCVINLLSNAAKFTENGIITLAAERAEAGTEERVFIEVRDTGIGMTDEQMAHIFQPFQQADASISAKYGGTGLGLSITRRIMEMLGGSVSVTSKPGVGTAFVLELPLRAPGAPAAVAVSREAKPARTMPLAERALETVAEPD